MAIYVVTPENLWQFYGDGAKCRGNNRDVEGLPINESLKLSSKVHLCFINKHWQENGCKSTDSSAVKIDFYF